ncbi:MAG: efflux RND transporter periplasmic adaptor subunit [Burkholderiales bacterium]|nr:efflux RND transporter periplasmic adaptor subunit [Burkholderiales bacterium]
MLALVSALTLAGSAHGAELATVQVRAGGNAVTASFDGVVQAVRQTVVAAQVSGAVVTLDVKVGDTVKAGQVLLRLDARAAQQTAAASDAQVQAARASQQAATKEFERQKLLFKQKFISQAALDRAEEQFKATQASVAAQLAGAGAARTTTDFYVVKAPYSAVVSDVPVVLGDMAMPGRPLLTVYDPSALRVSVNVPQTTASRLNGETPVKVELPSRPGTQEWIKPLKTQILPTVDPATHTQELRLDLPAGLPGLTPGIFARVWLNTAVGGDARLYVPKQAIVRRSELTGLYVIGTDGRPALRQVRLGRRDDGQVEVLSGVSAGEHVALDPQAASRIH